MALTDSKIPHLTSRLPASLLGLFQKSKLLAPTLLCLITLASFYQARSFDFLAIDDGMHTELNPLISPFTLSNISSFWTTPYENAYTPLTYTLWAVQAAYARNTPEQRELTKSTFNPAGNRFNAGVFHMGNLLVHIAAVLVFYFLIQGIFESSLSAFIGALLFAVHPIQVESISWITGFRDVLAGFFSVATIYFYIEYAKIKNPDSIFFSFNFIFTKKYAFYAMGLTSFILGVLCKSSTLMTPLIAALIAFVSLKRKPLYVFLDFLPWVTFIIPILSVFFSLNDKVALRIVLKTALYSRFFIAMDSIAFYIYKLVFPLNLSMDYGRSPQYVLGEVNYYFTALLPVLLTLFAIAIAWQKKYYWPIAAILIFIIGLGPVLGITPFIFQHISTVADRYVYLSMIGPCLLLSWLHQRNRLNTKFIAALSVIFCLLIIKSMTQVLVWKNNETIFSHSLKVNPRSWLSANNLGTVYEARSNYTKAMTLYEKAASLSNIPSAWNNAGAMAIRLKDYPRAVTFFERAFETSSKASWAQNNLGSALAFAGRIKEAKEHFRAVSVNGPNAHFIILDKLTIKRSDSPPPTFN